MPASDRHLPWPLLRPRSFPLTHAIAARLIRLRALGR